LALIRTLFRHSPGSSFGRFHQLAGEETGKALRSILAKLEAGEAADRKPLR
jgi:hypothetical protein